MKRLLIAAIIIIVVGGAIWLYMRGSSRGQAPRYLTQPVAYGDVDATVREVGTVNPLTQVQIGSEVSGTITRLFVDYNSIVKKGQVLAIINPTSFQAAATQAHGSLDSALASARASANTALQDEANISTSIATQRQDVANVAAAQANLSKAQAQLTLSNVTVSRDESLLSSGFIAKSQLDTDVAAQRSNAAGVNAAADALVAAQAALRAAPSQVVAARYQSAAAQNQASAAAHQAAGAAGNVQQADYNLSRTTITSPIDGIVVSRGVQVGQTVAASFTTPQLFVIASTLKEMEIDTSVNEADVGNLHSGATANITVPAYPYVTFHGIVAQLRVNPTTTQNVVSYDAVIHVHDEAARLLPGMTATVDISVDKRTHVLTVPTAALLYKPAFAIPKPQATGFFAPVPSSNTATVAGAPGSKVIVWVLRSGKPTAVQIVIGYNNGLLYEVRSGGLHNGDKVIIGQLQAANYTGSTSPFGGGRGR